MVRKTLGWLGLLIGAFFAIAYYLNLLNPVVVKEWQWDQQWSRIWVITLISFLVISFGIKFVMACGKNPGKLSIFSLALFLLFMLTSQILILTAQVQGEEIISGWQHLLYFSLLIGWPAIDSYNILADTYIILA